MAIIINRTHAGRKYIQVEVEQIGKRPVITTGYGDGEGEVGVIQHSRYEGGWLVDVDWPADGKPVVKVWQEAAKG